MSGLIGIIANDSARYSLFATCVTKLDRPEGSRLEWLIGGDWCAARNQLVEMTLRDGHDWLWFMDDDHAFPPSMLNRLLAHQLPLVTPICLTRVAPFSPVQYARSTPHGRLPIRLEEQPEHGLVRLDAGGTAGMLIRREVLAAIEAPWFDYTAESEDIVFCRKAAGAGFELWGDLGSLLGHITTAVVWPTLQDGRWMTGITVGRDLFLTVPLATEGLPEEDA